jgi:hypothetical protein
MRLIVPIIGHKRATIKSERVITLEHELVVENSSELPARNFNCHLFHVWDVI